VKLCILRKDSCFYVVEKTNGILLVINTLKKKNSLFVLRTTRMGFSHLIQVAAVNLIKLELKTKLKKLKRRSKPVNGMLVVRKRLTLAIYFANLITW
jgi:hypothetical protein